MAEVTMAELSHLRRSFSNSVDSYSGEPIFQEQPGTPNSRYKQWPFFRTTRYVSVLLLSGYRKFCGKLLTNFAESSEASPATAIHRHDSKTAWLDGLRGVASLLVMIHHSSWLWYPDLSRGWGSCTECYNFVQLPVIRVFYTGSAMVAIFFVVSGFSLSYRALTLTRAKRYMELLDSLCSSTFRRGIRLVLPPIILTFFMMLAAHYGFYGTGPGHRQPQLYGSFLGDFRNWFHQTLNISDIFRPVFFSEVHYAVYIPPYDPNLWTIDVEFNGSLVIFLCLLGTSKLLAPVRLLMFVAINLWLLYFVHSYLFLFMSGVMLAELHHIREDRITQQHSNELRIITPTFDVPLKKSALERVSPKFWSAFWSLNFIFALYIISMPLINLGGALSPGYVTLASWIPTQYRSDYAQDQFWIYLGAVHLVWVVDNALFLQSIFTTSFATYLSKISFALYLVHGTFLYTIGYRLGIWMHERTGRETSGQYFLGVILTVLCVYPLIIVTADLTWRYIDNNSVVFAKWLYQKISIRKPAILAESQYSELAEVRG